MLDKTVPYFNVILTNDGQKPHTAIQLPAGYTFCGYEEGLELEWVKITMDTNQFATFAEALHYFESAFLCQKEILNDQMIFVKNIANEVIATACYSTGHHFADVRQRFHFICVHPDYDGKGLHGAMVSKLLEVLCKTPITNFAYMMSSTWNYMDIHEYLTLGFEPYMGIRPTNWSGTPARFDINKKAAWEIIMNKIHEIYPPPKAEPPAAT